MQKFEKYIEVIVIKHYHITSAAYVVLNNNKMNDQLLNAISLLNLKKETATLISKGADWLDYDFETNPEDFLERAEQDFDALET